MSERQSARQWLVAVVVPLGIAALVVVLAWPRQEAVDPGPELAAPLETPAVVAAAAGEEERWPEAVQAKAPGARTMGIGPLPAIVQPDEPDQQDFLDDDTPAFLEVTLADGLAEGEAKRRYGMLLTPLAGIAPWRHTRFVVLESGTNRIQLAAVDWSCELLGFGERFASLAPGDVARLDLGEELSESAPAIVRVESAAAEAPANLEILARPARRAPLFPHPIGVPAADGALGFRVGPLLGPGRLLVAAPGFVPAPLALAGWSFGRHRRQKPEEHLLEGRLDQPAAELRLGLEGPDGMAMADAVAIFALGTSAAEVATSLHASSGPLFEAAPQRLFRGRREGDELVLDLPPNTVGRLFLSVAGARQEWPEEIATDAAGSLTARPFRLVPARRVALRARPDYASDHDRWGFGPRYGPLDDLMTRLRPTSSGAYLIDDAPIGPFAIGGFLRDGITTADTIFEVGAEEQDVVLTR